MTDPSDHLGPNANAYSDDERKHLDLIQAAIARMATASSTAKGWLLPVATAAFGYALTQRSPSVALLGIGAALLFAFLDAQYLRQERAFRALYRAAVARSVQVYDMNSGLYYGKHNGDTDDQRQVNCRWTKIIFSWTIFGFYGPVLLAGAAILFRALACR